MKIVYYCGNPHEERDSLPLKLIKKLKTALPDIKFAHFDPTEDISSKKLDKVTIIDSVNGIKKITVFNDLNDFALSPRFSVHDYDLVLDLNLLLKLNKIKSFKIIGVPENIEEKSALKTIKSILQSI